MCKDIWTRIFIATWIVGAKRKKKWRQYEFASKIEYLGKWSCIYAMDYHAVVRTNELVTLTFDLKWAHVILSSEKQN